MAPELTKEQRLENLEKAKQMRKARADIRCDLTNGTISAADVINRAKAGDKAASGLRVKQLINALPTYGFKRTRALMHKLGIAENKRVAGLGVHQTAALLEVLDGATWE